MLAKYMGWSWADEQQTPTDVLEVVVDMIQDEQREIAAARKR